MKPSRKNPKNLFLPLCSLLVRLKILHLIENSTFDFVRGTLIKSQDLGLAKGKTSGHCLIMSFYFLFSGLVQKLFQFALHPSFREETYHTPPPLLPKSAYYTPKCFDKIFSNTYFFKIFLGSWHSKFLVEGFD